MADTAVETIGEIIANLGGAMTATTVVPALDELKDLLGEGGITDAVDAWLEEHPEATTTVEDNSLTNAKFMDGSVNSRVIEDESITTDDIADLAVTTPKIADNAVTSAKVASDAVDGLRTMSATQPGVAKVGAGLAMYNGAIELDGNGDIAAAVTSWLNAHPEATTTVQDNSINTDKLMDNSINTDKLMNSIVTDNKLVQTGGILENFSNLKGAITENSYNLINGILPNSSIDSNGIVDTATGSGHDYALAYAIVEVGKTYIATTNDSVLVYAYFSEIPEFLDSSYDGRHVEWSVRTFTSPINGYVAYRIIGVDYKAQIVEGTEELPYANPLTAVDTYARVEILKESENLKAYVVEKAENTENYIFNYINHKELLDKSNVIEGYYVRASDGTLMALESFSVTDYIPVLPCMTINVVGGTGGSQVAYYDSNRVYISGVQTNASGFVVPATSTIAYMRWCTETTRIPTASLTVGMDTFVITGSDSLLHGIISARNGGCKKVLVQAGEYDLITEYKSEFGDDYFDTYAGAYNSLRNGYDDRGIWLDNVVIEFEPGAIVVCNYTGNNVDVREYFSCFAVGSNVEIIGLVLDAHNIRYGIHPDFHTQTYEKIVFRHCDLHHVKNNTNFHNNQSIGAGLGVHSLWIVEDCIFRSDTDHPVFRIHNNASAESESKIVIKNCYITGNGYILLNSYSTSTKQTIATVSGCSWITPAQVGKETEASSDNMTLIAWNNETRS